MQRFITALTITAGLAAFQLAAQAQTAASLMPEVTPTNDVTFFDWLAPIFKTPEAKETNAFAELNESTLEDRNAWLNDIAEQYQATELFPELVPEANRCSLLEGGITVACSYR